MGLRGRTTGAALPAVERVQATGDDIGGQPSPSGTGAQPARAVTLIFNPNAGGSGAVDVDLLRDLLTEAGYQAEHRATEGPEDVETVLRETSGPVFVAGGDGTFREVLKRLKDRDRPVALLPLGTANNSARTLGIEGPLQQVVSRLRSPRSLLLDLVRARGPWGEELIVEGAGVGVFANVLSAYRPDEGKSLLRAVAAAANNVNADRPVRCRVELDGRRLDGEYLMLEAMNMRAVGPRLTLAPGADPSDGLLDVVLVRYENRDALFSYLGSMVTSGLPDLPSVEVHRGRVLRLNWRGSPIHVDALTLCEEAREAETKGFSAQIEVIPAAVKIWLPAPADRS